MAKKKKKKAASKKKKEMLIVGSKAKATMKKAKVNIAGDALDGLNDLVHWHIDQATARAKENGRKTVRSHDFLV